MKCVELARHIEAVGGLIEGAGGSGEPARNLSRLLGVMPQKTVAQIAKVLQGENDEAAAGEVRHAAEFASAMAGSLKDVAKAALITDLSALADALANVSGKSVEELVSFIASGGVKASSRRANGAAAAVPDLREHLVLRYHRLLEHALGDDPGFAEVYRAVEADQDMRVLELVVLAKRFAFATVKSRSAALKKIHGRHQALMTSRAKTKATGGRLAG